jgi:hypothetical protein
MPKGVPLDAERYQPLLERMRLEQDQRMHCSEVAELLGCDGRNVASRLSFALENGLVHRVTEGRNTFYKVGPNPDGLRLKDDVGDFLPSLWGDGELVLRGLPEPNPDGSFTLSSACRRRLRDLLTGDLR